MTRPLEGRIAIVTGGNWNIGRAIARAFVRGGARVACVGRDAGRLAETEAALRADGGEVLPLQADVTDLGEVERCVALTRERFGTVDVLAAMAGGGGTGGPVDTGDPALWEAIVRSNLFGTYHCARAVLPIMRAKGRGSILTCTGGGGFFPLVGHAATAYACAKAAICRFTDQLAVELWESGVRVNCIQPGQVWSPIDWAIVLEEERSTGRPHPGRASNRSPEDAAELALWLASDASSPLTGRTIAVEDSWWRDAEKVRAVCSSLHAYCLRRVELTP